MNMHTDTLSTKNTGHAASMSAGTAADPNPTTDLYNRDDNGTDTDVHVVDNPPERTHNFNDLLHAAGALLLGVVVIIIAISMHGVTRGMELDAKSAGQAMDWLMDVPSSMLQQLTSFVIVIGVLIHLLIGREWLQSASSVIALFCGYSVVYGMSFVLVHLGTPSLLYALQSPGTGSTAAILPDIYAGIGAFLTMAGPRRSRSSVKWSWNALYAVAVVFVIVSWHSVVGVIVSFAIGRVIGLILRFAIGTRNKGLWGQQIIQITHSIGLDLTELSRRTDTHQDVKVLQVCPDDDLIENSRIYDASDRDGARYIVSVLDSQRHAAGYLNQLWQRLRFNGVSIRMDRSASDANHHHLATLLGLANCGLNVPKAYGVVDSDESSILVFEADGTPSPFDLSDIDDESACAFMRYLDRANRRGYTHRRITPETLARLRDGTPVIAGWQNGDSSSSHTNVAVDKVQLLMLLCTMMDHEHAIELAEQVWGKKTLAGLAPFMQKVIIPSQTTALPGWDKQLLDAVRTSLNALVPQTEANTAEPVTLARFNAKSFISITLLIVAVAVIFTQLKPDEVINAVKNANVWWALACLAFSMLAWAGSAMTLGAFMDKGRRHAMPLFCSQAASGLTAVSMPAGVGPAFVNLQFLRRNGYENTAATAIMSVTWAVQGVTTVVLLLFMGLFTGRNMFSGAIPTNTLIVVIGVIVLALSAAMAIPPVRHLLVNKYLPMLKSYARQLVDVLTQPSKLTGGVIGAIALNVFTGLGFWAALMAFGRSNNPIETTFVFLLANTLGSAIPTPGGLGAVEAALTFSFTSIGVPAAVALSATLVYRVAFYWLRIPIGALAMKWLNRHNLL